MVQLAQMCADGEQDGSSAREARQCLPLTPRVQAPPCVLHSDRLVLHPVLQPGLVSEAVMSWVKSSIVCRRQPAFYTVTGWSFTQSCSHIRPQRL